MSNITCDCCQKKIKNNKKFYIDKDGEYFCSDCVKEEYVKVFILKNDNTTLGIESEIEIFKNPEEYKEKLKEEIRSCEEWLKHYETIIKKEPTDFNKDMVQFYKNMIKFNNEKLKELF